MPPISRRTFIKRAVASSVAGTVALSGAGKWARAATGSGAVGTLIDLSKCNGCKERPVPACVEACRTENKEKFPRVEVKDIPNYWPQKKHEDWSGKQDLINRLTPYNWTYVETVQVEHEGRQYELHIQRRCMHCDNPPCANLCPFSAQEKTPEGPVLINHSLCFGGAKCRDVCPWQIPQRQAGVGLYMQVAPKYVGGGVMYKCDLCYDRIKAGGVPACVEACPREALLFGAKETMLQEARARAQGMNGYIYGEVENGGTSTFYVSPVPFEKIHEALVEKGAVPGMKPEVENYLDSVNGIAKSLVIAPLAGIFAAGYAAVKTMKGEE
ncbi:MAG TPA: 4Fe-4S dicluster domain-containing protein [Clostridia bacterium]|nr:4Fe-4S dicluster domain-containing protein [Clostridia bacterium]